jgi:crotonobetainyl-CoA:carnitine CoA-transferase CaiB-like acyl-CoA transferase
MDGEVPPQAGNDHPTLFPMGLFATRDGSINIAVLSGWTRFLEVIGAGEFADDPRFVDFEARLSNKEAVRELVEERLVQRTTDEWLELLAAAVIVCGPVLSVDETFADPQAHHLQLTRTVHHDQDGDLELLRHPVTFTDTPTVVRTPPPLLGSGTRSILGEHGYTEAEIDELLEAGVAIQGAQQKPQAGNALDA